MDPIAARRTNAGAPIVHGIHSLLWFLESIAENATHLLKAKSVKAQFRKPVYVGDEACAEIPDRYPKLLHL